MNRIQLFGILGFLLYFCCYVCAKLAIKQIIGPDFIDDDSTEDLILDCDFVAEGEEDVVVKWFFNSPNEQVYQWITPADRAYSSGPLKDLIDTNYTVSDDPNTMLRALKFKDVNPSLSGNYTCKVSSEASDASLTKQVIIYSPATFFDAYLFGEKDQFTGNEVVLCNAHNVLPEPSLDLYIAGTNGSLINLPETFVPKKQVSPFDDGWFYNISISLTFNSSFLDGTTKFVCQLSIPGTNYSDTKIVEYDVADNGKFHLQSSLLTVLGLLLPLLLNHVM